MPVALKNKIDLISPAFFNMLNDYVEYLVFKSKEMENTQKVTLANFAGTVDADASDKMIEAIKDCSKIEAANEW